MRGKTQSYRSEFPPSRFPSSFLYSPFSPCSLFFPLQHVFSRPASRRTYRCHCQLFESVCHALVHSRDVLKKKTDCHYICSEYSQSREDESWCFLMLLGDPDLPDCPDHQAVSSSCTQEIWKSNDRTDVNWGRPPLLQSINDRANYLSWLLFITS